MTGLLRSKGWWVGVESRRSGFQGLCSLRSEDYSGQEVWVGGCARIAQQSAGARSHGEELAQDCEWSDSCLRGVSPNHVHPRGTSALRPPLARKTTQV